MSHMPRHVAVVMDGNGRWAKQRGMPRGAGHRAGAKAVQKAVRFCVKNQIDVLTLFALSIENKLMRPESEVNFLMKLFLESLKKHIDELHQNNVKVCIVGDRSIFNDTLMEYVNSAEAMTASNTGLILNVAINYSGRWDILQATRKLIEETNQKSLNASSLCEADMARYLCFSDLPEPDLMVRTSGEQRISNFLLWQLAYTELFFTPTYWPDFDEVVFQEATDFYQTRQRRFGATTAKESSLVID